MPRFSVTSLLTSIWILALSLGFGILLRYSSTPGAPAEISTQKRPDGTAPSQLPSVALFVHPHCPCSIASIGELERLMPTLLHRARVQVYFEQYRSRPLTWAKESLWQKARAIPGVESFVDQDGAMAKAFGAKTSGQIYFYDERGNLEFEGGITPARGHMGENIGRDSIISLIRTKQTHYHHSAVFGCSLISPERARAGQI
jgi:hypothetical protein